MHLKRLRAVALGVVVYSSSKRRSSSLSLRPRQPDTDRKPTTPTTPSVVAAAAGRSPLSLVVLLGGALPSLLASLSVFVCFLDGPSVRETEETMEVEEAKGGVTFEVVLDGAKDAAAKKMKDVNPMTTSVTTLEDCEEKQKAAEERRKRQEEERKHKLEEMEKHAQEVRANKEKLKAANGGGEGDAADAGE